ncbi:MAG: transketolase [Rhodospirillaceae bacterium]
MTNATTALNLQLRRQIVNMVVRGNNGHIPSAFSILDIVSYLYDNVLSFDASNPDWAERDYFILSKGHGCLALYVNLHKHGFITDEDIAQFCRKDGILGEHPDTNKVPGAEASTGSLGHGICYAVGIALGHRIIGQENRIFVLIGDGESHEGTVWEAAHVARNLQLGQMCVMVDWNQSGMQLLPHDDLPAKWAAFGWNTIVVDGHDNTELKNAFEQVTFQSDGIPTSIIAKTTKGKGVPLIEGHGMWHHRIPNKEEYTTIMDVLS